MYIDKNYNLPYKSDEEIVEVMGHDYFRTMAKILERPLEEFYRYRASKEIKGLRIRTKTLIVDFIKKNNAFPDLIDLNEMIADLYKNI